MDLSPSGGFLKSPHFSPRLDITAHLQVVHVHEILGVGPRIGWGLGRAPGVVQGPWIGYRWRPRLVRPCGPARPGTTTRSPVWIRIHGRSTAMPQNACAA